MSSLFKLFLMQGLTDTLCTAEFCINNWNYFFFSLFCSEVNRLAFSSCFIN